MSKKKAPPNHIPVSAIDADPENQPRKKLDGGLIKSISATLMDNGEIREPVVVVANEQLRGEFDEEIRYTLFDGFHRYEAAVRAGKPTIPALVLQSRFEAYETAAERNAHGTRWTPTAARDHIVQGIKNGTYINPTGTPWPLTVMAAKYAAYGVTRRNLTTYLDKVGEADEDIAKAMAQIRAAYDKQNQPKEPKTSREDLAAMARERSERTAISYLDRAFKQMERMTPDTRAAILRRYGLTRIKRNKPAPQTHPGDF